MSADPSPAADRPTRWGLTVKLFGALLLLGGLAVLVTSVLGYVRARDALEESIYQQLTAARQTKARQVEEHFRTVRQDLLLLAHSKMVVEATRGFRTAVEQLDQAPLADGLRPKVEAWYEAHYMPDVRRLLGKDVPLADYMPVTPSGNYLQYHYIVANPHPPGRRDLLDDAHDGSDYSRVHAIHHPLLRDGGRHGRLRRLPDRRRQVGQRDLRHGQGGRLRDLPAARALSHHQPRRGRRPLRRAGRPVGDLPGGLRAVPAGERRAERLHGRTRDRPGRGDRRAGRAIVDRRDRPGGHRRPALAPGRLRRHRRSLSRRPGLPPALGWTAVPRESRPLFRRAAGRRASRPRRSRPSSATARRCCTSGSTRRRRARRWPASRAPAGSSETTASRHWPPGGRSTFRACVGGWSPRSRSAEAFAPIERLERDLADRGRPDARGGDRDRRLAVALADGTVARPHGGRAALRRRRRQRPGRRALARRDRPALPRLQRHGRRHQQQERR